VRERLRCPGCGARVDPVDTGFRCPAGHALRWDGEVLDATVGTVSDAATEATLRSFGYEWTTFSQVRPEDRTFWERYTELLPLGELDGAVALDAGCGMGHSRPTSRGIRWGGLAAASALRRWSVRMPHPALRIAAAPIAAVLYAAVVVPGALGARRGWHRLASMPLAAYRGSPLRSLWLDTFDRLSAPIECRDAPEEVRAWFTEAGFECEWLLAQDDRAGLIVLGRRTFADGA
jgi:hypothetical protein